jgi:ATP-dependent RNA helicase DDX3X
MGDTFATNEMQTAVQDISDGTMPTNAEAAAMAREKGWAEPSSYDYEEYGKASANADAMWGHASQKYEWQEEYGDVGPRNEELEEMLYHSEFTTRLGIKFEESVLSLRPTLILC